MQAVVAPPKRPPMETAGGVVTPPKRPPVQTAGGVVTPPKRPPGDVPPNKGFATAVFPNNPPEVSVA